MQTPGPPVRFFCLLLLTTELCPDGSSQNSWDPAPRQRAPIGLGRPLSVFAFTCIINAEAAQSLSWNAPMVQVLLMPNADSRHSLVYRAEVCCGMYSVLRSDFVDALPTRCALHMRWI